MRTLCSTSSTILQILSFISTVTSWSCFSVKSKRSSTSRWQRSGLSRPFIKIKYFSSRLCFQRPFQTGPFQSGFHDVTNITVTQIFKEWLILTTISYFPFPYPTTAFPLFVCCSNFVRTADFDMHSSNLRSKSWNSKYLPWNPSAIIPAENIF